MIQRIIAVGRLRERHWQDGAADYVKRLQLYGKIEVIEVPEARVPEKASRAEEDAAMGLEAQRIISKIKGDGPVVALDRQGREWDSLELAGWLKEREMEGSRAVTWVIGGPLGLAPDAVKRADLVLSLSRLTFPHQMVRLILLEQIYRGFRIIKGEPYHR